MRRFLSALITFALLAAFPAAALPCLAEDADAEFSEGGVWLVKVPEGYTVEFDEDKEEGARYLTLTPNDIEMPIYYVSITPPDEKLTALGELSSDMTDEELSEYAKYFTEEYNAPSVHKAATEVGTPLLVIDENNNEEIDYGEIVGFHKGCLVKVEIVSYGDKPLDEDDYSRGVQIISNVWFD